MKIELRLFLLADQEKQCSVPFRDGPFSDLGSLHRSSAGQAYGPGPAHMAGVAVYQQPNQQASAVAYQDIYRLLSHEYGGVRLHAE